MSAVVLHQAPADRQPTGVSSIVDAIGTQDFAQRLIAYLHDVSGADHFALFRLRGDSVSAVASRSYDRMQMTPMVDKYVGEQLWRQDPAMALARTQMESSSSSLIRVALEDERYEPLRPRIYAHMRDRVVICGRREHGDFGLSVLRSQPNPHFSPAQIEALVGQADLLVSAMAKHACVLAMQPSVAPALTDLRDILACLAARSRLGRREQEVVARILYGMSTVGTALDLGIGEESVRTYRKRAYQRLGIGTERELLRWYLAAWSSWRADVPGSIH